MSVEKERLTLILTRPYVDALNLLVESGIYMERQTAIRAALRLLFESHELKFITKDSGIVPLE